jgi:exopolyphosphatase/pppGpp-phosphohydrolase
VSARTPVVLECGSNSMKAHYRGINGIFQKTSFAWRLGHEVYSTGRLSEDTLRSAMDAVQSLLQRGFERRYLLAIATGALRDAENASDLLAELRDRIGLEVRVISGREEASLLAHGYLKVHKELPALLADIGGGSLEVVNLTAEKTVLRDSLPLGAIRVHYLGHTDGKPWNRGFVEEWVSNCFQDASVVRSEQVHGTGGTVKAISKVLGKRSFSDADLSGFLDRMEKEGPPPELKPARREVIMPGIIVLRGLIAHSRATVLHYTNVSIGRIFLERLLERLGASMEGKRKDYLLRDMRITNIYPQRGE